MHISHKIFFSLMFILSVILFISLQAAEFSPPESPSNKPLAKEFFETATDIAMEHFSAIEKIRDLMWDLIIKKVATKNKTRSENDAIECTADDDARKKWPLPEFSSPQTKQGLFFVLDDDNDMQLITPWGCVKLIGFVRISYDSIVAQFRNLVTIEFYKKVLNVPDDEAWGHSYIYKICAIDGKKLPEPSYRRKNWIEKNMVKKVWSDLEVEYQKMQKR